MISRVELIRKDEERFCSAHKILPSGKPVQGQCVGVQVYQRSNNIYICIMFEVIIGSRSINHFHESSYEPYERYTIRRTVGISGQQASVIGDHLLRLRVDTDRDSCVRI